MAAQANLKLVTRDDGDKQRALEAAIAQYGATEHSTVQRNLNGQTGGMLPLLRLHGARLTLTSMTGLS